MNTKEAAKKLVSDAALMAEAAGEIVGGGNDDYSARRVIGTLMFTTAVISVVDNMTEEDYFHGCRTAWESAVEMKMKDRLPSKVADGQHRVKPS